MIWTGFGIGDGCVLAGRCTVGNTLYYSSVRGVSRHTQWIGAEPAGGFPADVYAEILPHVERRFAGVRYVTGSGNVKTVELATVPLWYFLIALSIPPLLRFRSHLRAKKRSMQHGSCPNCGYDLRATPDRCPEMFSLL
jgi:hypothetical protein